MNTMFTRLFIFNFILNFFACTLNFIQELYRAFYVFRQLVCENKLELNEKAVFFHLSLINLFDLNIFSFLNVLYLTEIVVQPVWTYFPFF